MEPPVSGQPWAPAPDVVFVRPVLHWDQWLLADPDQQPTVQLPQVKCKRCVHDEAFRCEVIRAGERACAARPGLAGLLKLNPVQPQSAADAARCQPTHEGLKARPEFAFGLVLQEMWAGFHEISNQAQNRPDWTVLPPAELFLDPDKQEGRQEHMNLMDPAVRERYEENMVALPGPQVANVWFWEMSARATHSGSVKAEEHARWLPRAAMAPNPTK